MANCQKSKIDDLPAEPELDALVAEHVLGWRKVQHDGNDIAWETPTGLRTWKLTSFGSFQPSTDIVAAWETLELLKTRGWFCLIQDHSLKMAPGWRVVLIKGGEVFAYSEAESETVPLAICRAALKAVGVEEV